jgi:transcriptional regulator with XRE-family HTH domain
MSDVLVQFGLRVRQARIAKLWTLTQLAHEAFGNQDRKGYVSQIENGRKPITPLTVAKLAKALDLPAEVTNPILGVALPQVEVETEEDKVAEALIAANPAEATPDISESLMVALAYEYAKGSHGDLQSAYLGLRAALQTAAQMQQTARLPHNTLDQVDAVLAEVNRLNRAGQLEAGAQALDAALAEARDRVAQQTSGLMRMLDSAVDQARLLNRPDMAATALVERLHFETPADPFSALRALQEEWYERGRDQGGNFDLEVSLGVGEWLASRAENSRAIAEIFSSMGAALSTLGERKRDVLSIKKAASLFQKALSKIDRSLDTGFWASTQNNLGIVYFSLAKHTESQTDLFAALRAFDLALEVQTHDANLTNWAMTLNNRGSVLRFLGSMTFEIGPVCEAIYCHQRALPQISFSNLPRDWAIAQGKLADANISAHLISGDLEYLLRAEVAYEEAAKIWTKERFPVDWADLQIKHARVDAIHFARTKDRNFVETARLRVTSAIAVFEASQATAFLQDALKILSKIEAS